MLNHFWITVSILMAGIGLLTWSVALGATPTSEGGVWTKTLFDSLRVVVLLVGMVLFVHCTRHNGGKKTLR